MSFVKLGHHTFDEGRKSPEEAEITISKPSNSISVGQTFVQDPFLDQLGLQNSSSLRPSASSGGDISRTDITQIPKYDGHINHHEVLKPQGTTSSSMNSLGGFPQCADHVHEPGVRRRSSSHFSNSSEEIIMFSGRKQAKNKRPNATNAPISREGRGEDTTGSIGLTKLSSLIDPSSIKCERVSKPSRSASPEGASIGFIPCTKHGTNAIKRGRVLPNDPNPTGSLSSMKTRKYEQLDDHVIITNQIHANDGSRTDQVSDVSDDSSTDGMDFRFSSRGYVAHIKNPPRNQNNREPDFRLFLGEKVSPKLKAVSTQVSGLSVHCTEATERSSVIMSYESV